MCSLHSSCVYDIAHIQDLVHSHHLSVKVIFFYFFLNKSVVITFEPFASVLFLRLGPFTWFWLLGCNTDSHVSLFLV